MNPSQIPEKPLIASVNNNVEAPKKIYFFERENGTVYHTDERDAWTILNGRNQIVGRRPERQKLIGVSDGVKYFQSLKEAQVIMKTSGLEASQAHLRSAFAAELESARGKIEMPRNWDTTDNRGNPVDISKLMSAK